ncbi:MAG: hypothetical protein FWF43_05735 [Propionibacteriaceae bacterium]|nr:hypothetical protein [Propionibacteriaceae bacterium]
MLKSLDSPESLRRLYPRVFALAGITFLLMVLIRFLKHVNVAGGSSSFLVIVWSEFRGVASVLASGLGGTLLGLGILLVVLSCFADKWRQMSPWAAVALLVVSILSYAVRTAATSGSSSGWPWWAMELEASIESVTMLSGFVIFGLLVIARPFVRLIGTMQPTQ